MPQPPHTVLITGTPSGIGVASAIAATRAGLTTIATMRDRSRAGPCMLPRRGHPKRWMSWPIDVTDSPAVDRPIGACVEQCGRLEAVVDNAGSASVGTAESMALDGFRSAMEVNSFGVVRVTLAAMPGSTPRR